MELPPTSYHYKIYVITHNMLNCCNNEILNHSTAWDKVMCKNVTVSYNFSQSTEFKITQSNRVLHHILL